MSKKPLLNTELDEKAAEIGRNILFEMEKQKITRQQLGDAMKIQYHAVNQILRGRSNQQYAKLWQLARALKTTPNKLLGYKEGIDEELFIGALQGVVAALRPNSTPAQLDDVAHALLRILARTSAVQSARQRGLALAEFLVQDIADL